MAIYITRFLFQIVEPSSLRTLLKYTVGRGISDEMKLTFGAIN